MTNKELQKLSKKITKWIGSIQSIVVHTAFFILIFILRLFGASITDVLLILTTIVSLEAIYLSIFIQMTVNSYDKKLTEVSKDIEEIQEDIEEINNEE